MVQACDSATTSCPGSSLPREQPKGLSKLNRSAKATTGFRLDHMTVNGARSQIKAACISSGDSVGCQSSVFRFRSPLPLHARRLNCICDHTEHATQQATMRNIRSLTRLLTEPLHPIHDKADLNLAT